MIDWNKPDTINEKGVKWWLDKETTEYATNPDIHGVKLPNTFVYIFETPDGYRARLLIVDGVVMGEYQQLDTIGCKIDILKLAKRMKKSLTR